jgi:hypothetical protein
MWRGLNYSSSTQDPPTRKARAWLWTVALVTVGSLAGMSFVHPGDSRSPARAIELLLFLGSSVHVASSGWLYSLGDVRRHVIDQPRRYLVVPVILIVASASTAAFLTERTLSWLLVAYFAWQFFHFQKQNLGLCALACRSQRVASLRRGERNALVLAGIAGIGQLVTHPALLQFSLVSPLPGFSALPLVPLLPLLVLCCAVVWGVLELVARPESERPRTLSANYIVSLLFFLPMFVFHSSYAAVGGTTVAHGLQYLLLLGTMASRDGRGLRRGISVALLCNMALLGGVLLSVTSHLHSSTGVLRALFGGYLGVVMAHFVIDAGIWRMRDQFPRAFLARRLPFLVLNPASRTLVPVDVASAPEVL